MPSCRGLIAQPERGPRWDCGAPSPKRDGDPQMCLLIQHLAAPPCLSLPLSTRGLAVWECPENMSRCGVGGVFRSEKPLVAASGSHDRYLWWRGGDTGHRLPGSSGAGGG